MMRSWRLATEAARLDRAEREEEGLMPAMALVTVERLSWRWLSSAPPASLLFSRSDTSTGAEGGEGRGKTHRQGDRERQRQEKLLGKKKEWPVHREKSQELQEKAQAAAEQHRQQQGRAGTHSPARAAPQGTGLLGEADAGRSRPGLPGTLFCNLRSCIHQVWDQMSSPSKCHCLWHPLHLSQPVWFSLPRCPRLARSGSRG